MSFSLTGGTQQNFPGNVNTVISLVKFPQFPQKKKKSPWNYSQSLTEYFSQIKIKAVFPTKIIFPHGESWCHVFFFLLQI